jgi:hypothetical protein
MALKQKKRFAVNLPTPLADVLIEGTPKVYNDTGGSGNPVYRHFCGNCGSYVFKSRPLVSYPGLLNYGRPIMSVLAMRPDTAFLKGGLFKKLGFDLPQPVQQQWTRRCEKWETLMPGIKVIE